MKGVILWCVVAALLLTDCAAAGVTSITLRKVRETGSDRIVVFVHGFNGHPVETFRHPKTNKTWWNLMAGDKTPLDVGPPLSGYDVATVDYRGDYENCTSLDDMAKDIRVLLKDEKVFRDYNHVWFITHSMGGLVVKRMLADLNRSTTVRMLDRVSGVILLAVPSQGSPLAAMGTSILADFMDKILGYKLECKTRDLLPENMNTALQIIETEWRHLIIDDRRQRSTPLPVVHCAIEKKSTYGFEVVPRLYTSTACDGDIIAINADHLEIAKPAAKDSRIYVWARGRIEDSARLTAAHRTKSWPVVTAPPGAAPGAVEMLGVLIERLQRFHARVDPDTGLPEVDEVIEYRDSIAQDKLSYFTSTPGTVFRGNTWADLFEVLGKSETCLDIKISKDRRTVSVGFHSNLQERKSASQHYYTC